MEPPPHRTTPSRKCGTSGSVMRGAKVESIAAGVALIQKAGPPGECGPYLPGSGVVNG